MRMLSTKTAECSCAPSRRARTTISSIIRACARKRNVAAVAAPSEAVMSMSR